MIKLGRRVITSICLLGATYASAQTTFYVEGLGRAQVAQDELSGGVLLSDTVNNKKQLERKNTGGYTLLDLGINIDKKDKFYLNTILRGRSQFGLFWGEGTTFEFRKITMGGLIGSGIKYEIGDIYVEMSPYTLFMPDADYAKYESAAFGLRRGIVNYENFINGNSRFQQGLKSEGTLLFTKGIQKLHLKGFAVRTSEINQLGAPDVIMSGLSANAIQGKYGSFGMNFISLFDMPVATNIYAFNATTFTTSLNPEYKLNEKLKLGLDAEIGGSNYTAKFNDATPQDIAFSGYLLDVNAKAVVKPIKATIALGYKNVDANFRAPAAQTRRINDATATTVFPNNMVDHTKAAGSQLVSRNMLMYDRFTQENMYKQGVSYKLEGFNSAFNNINPYGAATPNRKGFQANIAKGDSKDVISLDFRTQILSEIEADNTLDNELRKFIGITSGVLFNVSKLAEFKKDLNVSVGYQSEKTTRSGVEKIDLSSSIIDVAVSAEFVENIDFLFGMKNYQAKGNEYITKIDRLNYSRGLIGLATFDSSEMIMSLGGRFRFTDKSAVTLNYSFLSSQNALGTDNDDYKWKQLFVNYTMKF